MLLLYLKVGRDSVSMRQLRRMGCVSNSRNPAGQGRVTSCSSEPLSIYAEVLSAGLQDVQIAVVGPELHRPGVNEGTRQPLGSPASSRGES